MAALDDHRETGSDSPIGIICGAGSLPGAVAEAAVRRGRPVFLMGIEGWAEPRIISSYPHCWIRLGQFGRARRLAQAAGCRDIVFIGAVLRPAVRALRLDLATVRLLPRLVKLFRGGDDRLLAGIGRLVEEHGFRMVGAHEIAPEILVPEGPLGRLSPSPRDLEDAAHGFALIEAIGAFDVGQAVVIADRHVLAIEAAEGTDGMLSRVADLRRSGRIGARVGTGVLVKAPKPQQDRRFDLPTIGPATVEAIKRAQLAGIIVRAREVIAAEPEITRRTADASGVFVAGIPASPSATP